MMFEAESVTRIERIPFYVADMMEADLEEVVTLEETAGLSRWGYDGYRYDLLQNPAAILLAARSDHPAAMFRRVLGFVMGRMQPSPLEAYDELHVNNIATHPDFRNMGVGRALMVEVMERAKLYGARAAVLEVRASNKAAQHLYFELGYSVLTHRRNYYSSPMEDGFIMTCRL